MFPNAGFPKAREHSRQSILISSEDNDVLAGMAYWNAAAGWALFRSGGSDIKIERTTSGGGWALWSSEAPYEACTIGIPTNEGRHAQLIAHELGHCLGFKHLDRGVMDSRLEFSFDRNLLTRTNYRASDKRVCDPGCHYSERWP